jgi:hypothetical protein
MKRAVIAFVDHPAGRSDKLLTTVMITSAAGVISALVLKERLAAPRLGCIGQIVAGAWVLRLAYSAVGR